MSKGERRRTVSDLAAVVPPAHGSIKRYALPCSRAFAADTQAKGFPRHAMHVMTADTREENRKNR
jgi:hypothetical protein